MERTMEKEETIQELQKESFYKEFFVKKVFSY